MKHEATLVRSAPYCGPPLLQAAVSCPCLRLRSPLRTLHLRHRQVLPSSQHLKGIAEIHRIVIILSSCTIHTLTVYIFTNYLYEVFLVHGSLIVQLPVWGPMTGRTLPPSLNSRNISHLMRRDNNKNGQDDKKLFFSVLIFQGAQLRGTAALQH